MLYENMFHALLTDKDFFAKVFPYITREYFTDEEHKVIYDKMLVFSTERRKKPSISDIRLLIETDTKVNSSDTDLAYAFLDEVKKTDTDYDSETVYNEAEKWAQDRAMEMAIMDSVDVLKDEKGSRGVIPEIMKKALAVSFHVQLGHDYFADSKDRFQKYNEDEEFVPIDVEAINKLLGGGFVKKALYMWLGRTNIGKTLILCHIAAALLKAGYNVVYFSAEMAENRIAQRIDANLLDISIKDLKNVTKKEFGSRLKTLYDKTKGRLFVKEYPTSTANALHMKAYLEELKIKKDFKVDFILADYLNIFTSSRIPASKSMESYGYIKAVTEEFRGLAVEMDAGVITATQTNRSGSKSGAEDMDNSDTSESFGVPMTVDWQGGIIQTPELFAQGKYLLKNLKSRFDDNINEIVTVGVERTRMRLFDVEESEKIIPVAEKDKQFNINKKQKNKDKLNQTFDMSDGD